MLSYAHRRRVSRGTPRTRGVRSGGHPTIISRLFFRRGCASTPSHGLCFPRESRLKRGILSTPVEPRAPRTSLRLGTRGEPPSGSGALEGLHDLATELNRARRAVNPPRTPRFGRVSLRGVRGGKAPTDDLPGVTVRTARRTAHPRVASGAASQTREALDRGWNQTRLRSTRLTSASLSVVKTLLKFFPPPQPTRAARKRYKFIREKENHDRHPWAG